MKIGKIISVEFDKFRVKLFHSTKTSTVSIEGKVYYFGNIGSYLKTQNTTGDFIICEVIAILDHNTESNLYSSYNLDSSRELVIKPIGTLLQSGKFNMGIGIFPSIYSDVNIVTIDDIRAILESHKVAQEKYPPEIHKDIEIGFSKNMINYRISLNINRLFNIHTAILGNSGSGKSNTIAHIIQEIYRKQKNEAVGAKHILFDVNGEYAKAFETELGAYTTHIFLKPNSFEKPFEQFHLPYYLMNLDEWLGFLMASERTQKPFWDRVLQECFKFYKILNPSEKGDYDFENYFKWKLRFIISNTISQGLSDTAKMTAARGIIIKSKEVLSQYDFPDLLEFLDDLDAQCKIHYGDNEGKLAEYLVGLEIDSEQAIVIDKLRLRTGEYFDYHFLKTAVDIVLLDEEAKGNSRVREYTSTMLNRLDYFLNNPDCKFMRFQDEKYSSSNDFLAKVFSIDAGTEKQLVVIDSSEVSSETLELLTSVVSRMIFDNRKFKVGDERRKNPVHLILDEAHRYIKKDEEYILKQNIFERIAREGRKFSMYLILSSQRPSELSATVLSQCGNYIIHRIQNEIDMKYIYSVLPFFSSDYTIKIKQQIPGEVLIFGNCVPMPLHIKVHEAKPAPNSANADISLEWFKNRDN